MNAERLLALYEKVGEAPDAITHLRRFVLDLAVRGKLVEQDPNDETAWLKQGPESADLPFELPKNWRWIRIGDQLDLLNGIAFKPTDWVSSGVRIVRIQNLNNPDAPFNYCRPEMARDRSLIDDGSFLISWSGTPGTSFGAFIWARGPAVLNQHIFRCDFRTNFFDPQFLKLAVNGRLDEMIAKAHGGVGLQHITKGKLEAMLIPLPPLAEQRRVVAKVEELMALLDRLEAARTAREATRDRLTAASLARLTAPDTTLEVFPAHARFALDVLPALTSRTDQIKSLRQTILNLAVRGQLVEQDPRDKPASELLRRIVVEKGRMVKAGEISTMKPLPRITRDQLAFTIPPHWEPLKLCEMLDEIQTGPFGSSLHQSDYVLGGTPVINPASLQNDGIVPIEKMAVGPRTLERLSSFTLCIGDIVMARRGEMGRCALVTEAEAGWLCGTGSLILRPSKLLYAPFLVLMIGSPFSREYLGGTAVGTTMQNLNQSILLNLSVGLPPLAEQRRIVAKVEELMALCDRLEASLATADTTKQRLLKTLLHKALEPTLKEAA